MTPEEKLFQYLKDILYNPRSAALDVDSLPTQYRNLAEGLSFVESCLTEYRDFTKRLSDGEIAVDTPSKENIIAAPVKDIHAKLSHLNWLMKRLKEGDYYQRLDFMGELTESFNGMVDSLVDKVTRDELTGLYNKFGFVSAATKVLGDNPDKEYVLLRWDVDNFKIYNDLFGIKAGDDFLRGLGEKIREDKTARTVFGRYIADHFVLLAEKSVDIDRIIRLAFDWYAAHSETFTFTVNFGVYEILDRTIPVEIMCDRALLALLTVKGNTEKSVAYYDDTFRDSILREQYIINNMNEALEQKQFEVYLQPQYCCQSGKIVAAEALVRWNHPQKGFLSPGLFIPVFEKNGFVTNLDIYVWEETCVFLRKLIDMGFSVPISVNVSRNDLFNPNLVDIIVDLTKKYGIPHNMLNLEITESSYMEEPQTIIHVVQNLKSHGFRIEMDDFGSGYSSLNSLKDIAVDVLKLDLRFLEGEDEKSKIIVEAMIKMASKLHLPVIAEGVETASQLAFLRESGCSYAQGYFFARPMSMDGFLALLKSSQTEEFV